MMTRAPIACHEPLAPDDPPKDLADRAFAALAALVRGCESAEARDRAAHPHRALADPEHLHRGLLTVLLRLVFMRLAEERGLLAADHGVSTLYHQLQQQARIRPDATAHTFDAWPRLLAAWRVLSHPFFAPDRDPIFARIRLDDHTVAAVLDQLAGPLDIEDLGGVHEALLNYRLVRLPAPAVCLRPQRSRPVWLTAADLRAVPEARRTTFLHERAGLSPAAAARLAAAIVRVDDDAALLDLLAAAPGAARKPAGHLVLQPDSARRRAGSHYTPRALTRPVVRTALAPLLAASDREPTSAQILDLAICDPAMGAGAFLVAVIHELADHLVAAWQRERTDTSRARAEPCVAWQRERTDTSLARARRLVAARCIYGADRDPLAVDLARLTVWLVAATPQLPLDTFDHALRCGDSLLGLDAAAIAAFHWQPAPRVESVAAELHRTLAVTAPLRRRIRDLATADDLQSHHERARLQREVDARTEPLRIVADLAADAFFSASNARARESARQAHLTRITAWLDTGQSPPPELQHHRARFHAARRPFHWVLEFPEIFHSPALTDPPCGMHAVVGNPPFMAGGRISGTLGLAYLDWLLAVHPGAHGNADLSAHFFRRADALVGQHGTIALIATNTIGQGDTRATGLQHLLTRRGWVIYETTRDLPWPEDATVTIAIVHLARGAPARYLPAPCLRDFDPADPAVLVPRLAPAINSRLHPAVERPDPRPLASNADLSFIGSKIYGQGFILTPAERDALIARNPANAARIFPYIGGDEVHTSPDQRHHRYVISFERMDLEQAEQWPDLLAIVRARVLPVRERQNREIRKKYWWRFGEVAPALYHAIAGLPRCLVISGVSKHVAFSFQPVDRIFSHALVVISLAGHSAFAALQSRIHAIWARTLCSSMKTDLRYTPSDCFENFPFPQPDPRAELPELAAIGEALESARRALMTTTRRGLTTTYNALHDPACDDPAILALRELHRDLDRAVLTAYGWHDLLDLVPAYTTPRSAGERQARATFADTVFDRLLALNERRACA